jgi:hypothetical protein
LVHSVDYSHPESQINFSVVIDNVIVNGTYLLSLSVVVLFANILHDETFNSSLQMALNVPKFFVNFVLQDFAKELYLMVGLRIFLNCIDKSTDPI